MECCEHSSLMKLCQSAMWGEKQCGDRSNVEIEAMWRSKPGSTRRNIACFNEAIELKIDLEPRI